MIKMFASSLTNSVKNQLMPKKIKENFQKTGDITHNIQKFNLILLIY